MTPIHTLLNRIRRDPVFGAAKFEVGYYDRLEESILRIPLCEIFFEPGNHFTFHLYDHDGELHSIPLHRVKQVFRGGELIRERVH